MQDGAALRLEAPYIQNDDSARSEMFAEGIQGPYPSPKSSLVEQREAVDPSLACGQRWCLRDGAQKPPLGDARVDFSFQPERRHLAQAENQRAHSHAPQGRSKHG